MKYGFIFAMIFTSAVCAESDIEITSFWNTDGELKALNEITKNLKKTDISSEVVIFDGYTNLRNSINERISIGHPPEVSHWQWSTDLLALAKYTKLTPIPHNINGHSLDELIVPEALNQISFEGEYIALPIGIHLQGVMLYNQSLLASVGITTAPQTWEEFFQLAYKLDAKGIRPFSFSSETWILRDMFDSVLGSVGGTSAINDIYGDFDRSGDLEENIAKTLDIMFRLEKFGDDKMHERRWWQLIDDVAEGTAASTMIGDFAQSQITMHPEDVAKNVICNGLPGEQVANFGVDVFVTFQSQLEHWKQDYPKYVETVLTPETQKSYLSFKGGIPVLSGVEQSELAQCASNSLKIWNEHPEAHIAVPSRDDIAIAKLYRALPPIWHSNEHDPKRLAELIYKYLSDEITEQTLLKKLSQN